MRKGILVALFAIIVLVGGVLIIGCDPITRQCFGAQNMTNIVLTEHASPADFKMALASGEYKLLDIRTEEEFSAGHINNSEQIDFYKTEEFLGFLDSLDKNQKYLIYCRTGNRSAKALEIMKQKGFKSVSDLDGGISAWVSGGYLVEK